MPRLIKYNDLGLSCDPATEDMITCTERP